MSMTSAQKYRFVAKAVSTGLQWRVLSRQLQELVDAYDAKNLKPIGSDPIVDADLVPTDVHVGQPIDGTALDFRKLMDAFKTVADLLNGVAIAANASKLATLLDQLRSDHTA